ncbi:MAG: CRTAC1 family protein [Planctomycetota bacterium]|nr:CRTAC1 family protein [Planctomycetota bacterium]
MSRSSGMSRVLVLVGLALLAAALWFWRPWDSSGRGWFTDTTRAAGIGFEHSSGRTGSHRYLEIVGGGVGMFDYDGDGWLDLYFVNGNHIAKPMSKSITNILYRNNHDGTFTDVTAQAGVGDAGFGQGCCAADFDNDGDQDLYVTNYGLDRFYRNNGDGTFSEVGKAVGVVCDSWGQSCAFFDADGDGWLDLYVQNYLTYAPAMEGKRADYNTPTAFKGAPDRLYLNKGDGTFRDVSVKSGLHRPDGRGMGVACVDFDGDGDLDLFVANDGMENYYFQNKGDATFEERSVRSGLAFNYDGASESSMGVDVGDFDGDGQQDIACPALRSECCTLYKNGNGLFDDVSRPSRLAPLTRPFTGFSPNWLDVDNDGDLDLFLCNGGVARNLDSSPQQTYLEQYGVPDLLVLNDGQGRFAKAGPAPGAHFERALIGRGSAAGDLDNDGDIDLVVCNLNGAPNILRNDAPQGHWLTLVLVPSKGHRDPIGAKIKVTAGGRSQTAVVRASGGYLSLNDRRPHFGLGAATTVERIEIVWPDGSQQVLTEAKADQILEIRQT